jgi:hypothetical protein
MLYKDRGGKALIVRIEVANPRGRRLLPLQSLAAVQGMIDRSMADFQ